MADNTSLVDARCCAFLATAAIYRLVKFTGPSLREGSEGGDREELAEFQQCVADLEQYHLRFREVYRAVKSQLVSAIPNRSNLSCCGKQAPYAHDIVDLLCADILETLEPIAHGDDALDLWRKWVRNNRLRLKLPDRDELERLNMRLDAESIETQNTNRPNSETTQSKGNGRRRGRGAPTKKETKQRADYAKPLIDRGLTWPEIFKRYAKTSKGKADKDANADAMRLAYGREYPAT